jgi:hypothetical protein
MEHSENKHCTKCGVDKPITAFHLHGKGKLVRRSWCSSCSVNSLREYRHKYKNFALALLGGKCALCGESEREFLSIDHMHGGGCIDRRLIGTDKIYKLIADGFADLTELRVLCRNCNDSLQITRCIPNERVEGEKQKLCSRCGLSKSIGAFKGRSSYCRACRKSYEQGLKVQAFATLGGECACCGQDDVNKLTIDHLNGDGAALRKRGGHAGVSLYAKVIAGEPGFRLLCWNCNFSAFLGHGVCVHERRGDA